MSHLTPYDARELIAIHDPLLARSINDDQAVAIAQGLADARWGGTVSGAFWSALVIGLVYYGRAYYEQNKQQFS